MNALPFEKYEECKTSDQIKIAEDMVVNMIEEAKAENKNWETLFPSSSSSDEGDQSDDEKENIEKIETGSKD